MGNSFKRKKTISPRPLVSSPVPSTIWNSNACVHVIVCVCWHGNIMCIILVGDPGVIHLEQNKLIYDIFQHVQCLWNIEISKKQNSSKTGWRADILSLPADLPFPPAHLPIYRMETFRGKNSEQLLWKTTQTSPHLLAYSRWAHFSGGCSLTLWGPLKSTLGGTGEERGSGPRWRRNFLTSENSLETG